MSSHLIGLLVETGCQSKTLRLILLVDERNWAIVQEAQCEKAFKAVIDYKPTPQGIVAKIVTKRYWGWEMAYQLWSLADGTLQFATRFVPTQEPVHHLPLTILNLARTTTILEGVAANNHEVEYRLVMILKNRFHPFSVPSMNLTPTQIVKEIIHVTNNRYTSQYRSSDHLIHTSEGYGTSNLLFVRFKV